MAIITGTPGPDILTGTAGPDTFDGLAGEDTVTYEDSRVGLNILMIPSADATGAAAGDIYKSIENIRGTHYNDYISGNEGNNKLYGLSGSDTLFAWFGGQNSLYGGAGVDNLVSGPGADHIDGGDGIDTLSYQLADIGMTVSLADPSINTGWGKGDTYVNVEDLTGTNYDDVIYGDDQPVNNLWGLAGNDRIYGGAGYDVMIGDAGADYLDGGEGTDLADYETAPEGLWASLADPSRNTGHAKGDVYVSIEDIAGSKFNDMLWGDHLSNGMDGWPGDDILYGGAGNDGLDGGEGNDLLYGEDDWDLLDGGAGRDTAGFYGPIANYRVWISDGVALPGTAGELMVGTDIGNEGTDRLHNIERILFSDMSINLTAKQSAAGIGAGQLKVLQELYIAFFNRLPDADGLEYWVTQLKQGQSINSIAEQFYAAGVEASHVTGYRSDMSNSDFVDLVYRNVLGRNEGADTEGLRYWSSALASGAESRGSLVSSILGSAHTFKGDATWGWVANLLDNKAAMANLFAVQMGLNFLTADESISKGIEIAAAITPNDTAAALALIGVNPDLISF